MILLVEDDSEISVIEERLEMINRAIENLGEGLNCDRSGGFFEQTVLDSFRGFRHFRLIYSHAQGNSNREILSSLSSGV